MIERIADITLERYRLRELPDDEMVRVEALLTSSVQLRLSALDKSDTDIAASHPAAELARAVKARLDRDGDGFSNRRWLLMAVGVVAVAIIAAWPAIRPQLDERVKGGTGLTIYRSTPSGTETLSDNAMVRAGDVILVGYRTDTPGYGAILSIDGRGEVTRHLPPDGDRSVPIKPGGVINLNTSFQLDDAPEYERFLLITSSSPFDIAAIVHALQRSDGQIERLALPQPLKVVTFSLRKDTHR